MISKHAGKLVFCGFFLVFLGVLLPLLMVVKVIEASFVLSFVAYASSAGGLLLGIVGAVLYWGGGEGS